MDRHWGWIVVLGGFICHVCLIGMSRNFGLLYIIVQERFESTASQTAGTLSTMLAIVMLLGEINSILAVNSGVITPWSTMVNHAKKTPRFTMAYHGLTMVGVAWLGTGPLLTMVCLPWSQIMVKIDLACHFGH